MFIGLSIGKDGLPRYRRMFPANDLMRVFPNKQIVDGRELRVLPKWDDPRLNYCRDLGVMPFLSTKIDGHRRGLELTFEHLSGMPDWILGDPDMRLYLTDRHEPEDNLGPEQFKENFAAYLGMLKKLPTAVRRKIKCGPILTKTWVDQHGGGKWHHYDPASIGAGGDFFGGDMYVLSGTSHGVVTRRTLPDAATFTKSFKAYRHDDADTRPRLWPEFGLIGFPEDRTGQYRADWIRSVHDEVGRWHRGAPGWSQPWNFHGFVWYNQVGKKTGDVPGIGYRRDFELDRRTVDKNHAEDLPGHPPLPVKVYNELIRLERRARQETPVPA